MKKWRGNVFEYGNLPLNSPKRKLISLTLSFPRLNPINCKAFNADFDGDEINAFFHSSNATSRASCFRSMRPSANMVSPGSNLPLVAFSQDYITSAALMARNEDLRKDKALGYVELALAKIGDRDVVWNLREMMMEKYAKAKKVSGKVLLLDLIRGIVRFGGNGGDIEALDYMDMAAFDKVGCVFIPA